MRISGTELSSVIMSQTKYFQNITIYAPKLPKQAGAKRNGVNLMYMYTLLKYDQTHIPNILLLAELSGSYIIMAV